MKQLLHLPLLLLFACPPAAPLAGQEIQVLWDSLYFGLNSERLNDLLLLPDGRLAGAGEVRRKDKSTNGLFVLIDPVSGRAERRSFGGTPNQSFSAVAEADDGTFYLVGTSDDPARQQGKQGWLLRLDETGSHILADKKIGGKGDDRFEKIAWLDNGTGMVAGFKKENPEGHVWMLLVDGDEDPKPKDAVGNGYVSSIAGMGKDATGRVWLTCNTLKSMGKQNIWLAQLDENALSRNTIFLDDEKYHESAESAFVTPAGDVLVAGQTWVAINGESDAWSVRYDNGLDATDFKSFDFDGDDLASCAYQSPSGKSWLVQRAANNASSLYGWEAEGLEERLLTLGGNSNFRVAALLKTHHNTYIAAGTSTDPARRRDGIRVICFKNGETLAAKGLAKLEMGDPKFEDANKDGFLSPGERASLHFTIKNTGDVPVKEGKIKVVKGPMAPGLSVLHEVQYLPYLPVGSSKNFYIGLKGEDNLKAGKSSFSIVVEAEAKQVINAQCEVESIEAAKAVGGQKAQMTFYAPALSGAERKVSVSENVQELRLSITSSRPLKAEDLKVVNNRTVQQDKKAETSIRSLGQEKGAFVYDFSTVVTLNDSINVVYVMLDDEKTDSIVFEWRSHFPDLHVLAIGPTYADLKYTTKDASDFAKAFARQAGMGFFDQVFVDTLLTTRRTSGRNIELAFKKLLERDTAESRPDHIKPNDYLIIFYSGHGVRRGQKFFLVPSDYEDDDELLLDYRQLLDQYIRKIQCKKLLFLDACHSGSAKSGPADMAMARALIEANRTAPGLLSFTSCSENELSYEDASWENGAFTEAILEALDGAEALGLEATATDAASLPVPAGKFFEFLKNRVRELVASKGSEAAQTPTITQSDLKETLTIFAVQR